MKFILGFFRVVISFVLVIALSLLMFAYGLVKPVVSTLTPDNLSSLIKECIGGAVEEIIEEAGTSEELKEQINNFLQESDIPLDSGQVTQVLQNPDIQNVVSDYLSSAVLHAVDETVEVDIPEKEELKTIAINNKADLLPLVQDQLDHEPTDEEINQFIDENYDYIVQTLRDYADELAKEAN